MHNSEISLLYKNKDEYIAYLQRKSKANAHKPGVIFLPGFHSDMTGTKAVNLKEYCQAEEFSYLCLDYRGCGSSSGNFTDGTIGGWLQDVLLVLDQLTETPQILVGSSMGGWLMLLAALARPERIAGLIGIAAAPDFTEDLVWEMLDSKQRHELALHGMIALPSEDCSGSYPITRALIEEGRQHLVLPGKIPVNCPIRLLHGMKDDEVPYHTAFRLMEQLASSDVQVTLVKNANHRMSAPEDLQLLRHTLRELMTGIESHRD